MKVFNLVKYHIDISLILCAKLKEILSYYDLLLLIYQNISRIRHLTLNYQVGKSGLIHTTDAISKVL